ncbi:hypothetical protein KEM48_007962 [Puccinia striiformis f. sp. tritici PST-130]|nr:hypothetical protein KEM48_007962 [Puccinia striiformis f. sp. tritici PST-130]
MASQRPGAHPGHQDGFPMALEHLQAIRMASRWLWSISRPSGWLPDGSGASPGHQDGFPMALEHLQAIRMASRWLWSISRPSGWLPNGLELIQAIQDGSQRPLIQAPPNGLELIQAIGKPSQRPGGATFASSISEFSIKHCFSPRSPSHFSDLTLSYWISDCFPEFNYELLDYDTNKSQALLLFKLKPSRQDN